MSLQGTDQELAAASCNGSVPAFAVLVERYQERLHRFLVMRCGNKADAEDALQETFLNAYRYMQSYNPRWQFSTWIYRIAIRNLNRARRPPEQLRESLREDLADASDDPLQACIVDADRNNLWLAARQILATDCYSALWLHYVEDMSVKDVARALGRSVAWTKVNLFRGRQRLGKTLVAQESNSERKHGYGPV